jgi:hypothetical protein
MKRPWVVVTCEHAVERMSERGAASPPKDKMVRLAERVEIMEEFHVREFLYTWVCKRIGVGTVMILTVWPNVGREKPPRQRRMEIRRARRLARKQKTRLRYDDYYN